MAASNLQVLEISGDGRDRKRAPCPLVRNGKVFRFQAAADLDELVGSNLWASARYVQGPDRTAFKEVDFSSVNAREMQHVQASG
jgi:hypothetical protein